MLSAAVSIPNGLDLTIAQRRETRRIRIIWRRGDEAGAMFLHADTRSGLVSLDLARRLRACEAERTTLARRVAELSSTK
jgi:hypothetical protein